MIRFGFQQAVAPAENSNRNKVYVKEIDGQTVKKKAKDIVLKTTRGIVFNPSEAMLLADGWTEYVRPTPPEPTEEQKFAIAKERKKAEIERYDKSSAVNQFFIGETPMWLDKETRTGLKLRFEAEIAMGKTDTTLWADGVQYPLPLSTGVQMLYALEVYASMCYDQTQAHLAAIDALTTIEEVEAYDYATGYPDKLHF